MAQQFLTERKFLDNWKFCLHCCFGDGNRGSDPLRSDGPNNDCYMCGNSKFCQSRSFQAMFLSFSFTGLYVRADQVVHRHNLVEMQQKASELSKELEHLINVSSFFELATSLQLESNFPTARVADACVVSGLVSRPGICFGVDGCPG